MTDLAWVWTSHRIKLKDEEKKLFNFINRRLTVFEGGTLNAITSHNLIKTCISIVGTRLRNVGDKLVISRADYRSTPHKSHGALILNDTPQLNYTTASSSHPQHPSDTPTSPPRRSFQRQGNYYAETWHPYYTLPVRHDRGNWKGCTVINSLKTM